MFRQAVVPIICVAIIIAAVYQFLPTVKSQEAARRAAAAAAAQQTDPPAKPKPAPRHPVRVARAVAPELVPAALRGKPAFPFPTATEIPAGTRKADLWAEFGQPSLTAATYDRSRLSETVVYVRADASAITYAWLTDGRVVRATTATR